MGFELPSKLRPATSRTTAQVACSDLTLWSEGRPPAWGDTELKSGSRTPLTTAPGGGVIGHIATPQQAPPVNVGGSQVAALELPDIKKIEEKAGSIRVRLGGGSSAAVGWSPKSAVDGSGRMAGVLGMLQNSGVPRDPSFTCSREVDLVVDHEGARVRVGVIRAGAAVAGERRDQAAPTGRSFGVPPHTKERKTYASSSYSQRAPTSSSTHSPPSTQPQSR